MYTGGTIFHLPLNKRIGLRYNYDRSLLATLYNYTDLLLYTHICTGNVSVLSGGSAISNISIAAIVMVLLSYALVEYTPNIIKLSTPLI